jgi:tRNA A-37 threonylcarbamoyl transferase component Bud32
MSSKAEGVFGRAFGGASVNKLVEAETILPGTRPLGPSETSGKEGAPLQLGWPRPSAVAGYEIVEELGRGGMGIVYKARQVKLDRTVALKLLRAEASSNVSFIERFLREARALAKLNHPNIVTVHDFGQEAGQSYLVMEYVDGVNLRERMRGGRMAGDNVRAIALQLCDALDYAHAQSIVHRDIKPENILIDKGGRVRIADFGIAKLLAQYTGGYTLTGPWQVVGTLRYMAPEQLDSPLSVDHRADIYSLGLVVYEMLTGELPSGRFALPSQTAGVDGRWDALVLRALEKKPEQRFLSAAEFRSALAQITPSTESQPYEMHETLPANTKAAQPRLIAVSMLLVLAIIVWPVGLALAIPGLIWLGLVLRRPDGKAVLRRQLSAAETMIRGLLNTTYCAMIACLAGLLTCLLAWNMLPPSSGPVIGRDSLEIIALGTYLTLLVLLVATPSRQPIPIWQPAAIMIAGLIVMLATGMLHALSVPYSTTSRLPFGTRVGLHANGVSCAFSIVLLLLGALQMRGILKRRHSESGH